LFLPISKDEQVGPHQHRRNAVADPPITLVCIIFTRKLEIAKEKSSKFALSSDVGNSPARIFDENSGALARLR